MKDISQPLKMNYEEEKSLKMESETVKSNILDLKTKSKEKPPIITQNLIKNEVKMPNSNKKKSRSRRSRKVLFLEYSKWNHELKVIIQRTKGDKTQTKIHRTTVLKSGKVDKRKPIELINKFNNLTSNKLLHHENSEHEITNPINKKSIVRNKPIRQKIKKTPKKKETKSGSIKSTKRVLIK